MPILNFNVGPSALFPGVEKNMQEILQSKILETSHRSNNFSNMSQEVIDALKRFLCIPDSYKVFYTCSATEAMEIALRNGIEKKSTHFTNGAFGEKWQKMAQSIGLETENFQGNYDQRFSLEEITAALDSEGIFITANETSTSAAFSNTEIKQIKEKFPQKLLCIDATSCAGAIDLDISQTDLFLFSVQKCFGLPSGLGILICSERFYQKAVEKKNKGLDIGAFNSLPAMWGKMAYKFQTCQTPPIIQIALLGKIIRNIENKIGSLQQCDNFTNQKAQKIYQFFENHKTLKPFIKNKNHRSKTVIVITSSEDEILKAKQKCQQKGIILANGYGKTKPYTFRLANFLAHSKEDFENVFNALSF